MSSTRIGLVVRSAPFAGRSGRDQLDIALAAATLGFEIEICFLGEAVLQLSPGISPEAAGLPGGIRGWRSLPELTRVTAWANGREFDSHSAANGHWALDLRAATKTQMAARMAACARVLVL